MLCCYSGLNDPVCCIHRSGDSQCFSIGPDNPKLPIPVRISTPRTNGYLSPHESAHHQTASPSVEPFLHSTSVLPKYQHKDTQTDTQTTLCAAPVAIGRIVCTACTQCGLTIGILCILKNSPKITHLKNAREF